ncbi:hypothetical protein BDQ17DRAFT_381249 [Cyathus striatus]|nr:hypothetical protein BDQ17DRAFT_381249 [Cyathus striatus]
MENYSDSELSSLPSQYDDSSDEEQIPVPALTASKRKPAASCSLKTSQRNRNPYLPPPRTCTYSAWSLREYMKDHTVDLNPDYQREIVWSDIKQGNLIDSIMHNYYIPPVVFATKMSEDGETFRVCIDGKQRLTSILRFMDGEIAYKDSINGRKAWYTDESGSRRKLITDSDKKRFDGSQITCVEYNDISEDQEREIFQRVQMGVSLTCAERLAAINGPHARIVRSIQDYLSSANGFNDLLDWGHARNKDFQIVAQVVFLIGLTEQKTKNKERKAKLDVSTARLGPFLGRKTLITDSVETSSQSVFEIFCCIVRDKELRAVIRANEHFAPIEFVMASYLIFMYRSKMSYGQLAEAIHYLRLSIHKFNNDKRFNNLVFNHAMDYIKNRVPKLKYSYGLGDPPAYYREPVTATKGKRKHAVGKESDMDSRSDITIKRARKTAASVTPAARQKRSAAADLSSSSDDEGGLIRKTVPRLPSSASRTSIKAGSSAPASAKTSIKRISSKSSLAASVSTGGTQSTIKKPASSGPVSVPQTQTARPSKKPLPSLKTHVSTHTLQKQQSPASTPLVVPFPKRSRQSSLSSLSIASAAPSLKSEMNSGTQIRQTAPHQELDANDHEPVAPGSAPPAVDTHIPRRGLIPSNSASAAPVKADYPISNSSATITRPDRLAPLRSMKASLGAIGSGGLTNVPASGSMRPVPPTKKFPDFKKIASQNSTSKLPFEDAGVHFEELRQEINFMSDTAHQSNRATLSVNTNVQCNVSLGSASSQPLPTPGYTPTPNSPGSRRTINDSRGAIESATRPNAYAAQNTGVVRAAPSQCSQRSIRDPLTSAAALITPNTPSNVTNGYFCDQQIAGQKRSSSPSWPERPIGGSNSGDPRRRRNN